MEEIYQVMEKYNSVIIEIFQFKCESFCVS